MRCGAEAKWQGHRTEIRLRLEEAGDHLFVLLGLAGTGRIDESAARPHRSGRGGQDPELQRRDGVEVGCGAPPLDVGIAAQRAQPRAGRVDEDAVEDRGKRQRLRRIGLDDARRSRRRRRRRCRPGGAPAWRGRRRPRAARHCPWRPPSQSSCLPAPRRRRGSARPAAPRATSPTSCEASSCTTNSPCDASGVSRGLPRGHDQAVGRERAGRVSTPACCRVCASSSRVSAQAVGAQRQRRRLVVEPAPRFGRLEPVARPPALDQPSRMRQRLLEVVDLAGGIA